MPAASAIAHLPIAVEGYGDSAVMVTVSSPDAVARREGITVFRQRVLLRRPHGVVDLVSGLESLLVEFDALETSVENVDFALRMLAELPAAGQDAAANAVLEVPFVVDAESAPDLAEVARELAIGSDELIARIESSTFTVALLAAAMAPMMAGLDVPAPVRRRAEPRTNVPAGAVMIAGENAIIQPFPGPSGWRVIGRTPMTIVDIARPRPVSFAPGDTVRFRRIDRAEERLHGGFLTPGTESVR